jgi:hypothetical protein
VPDGTAGFRVLSAAAAATPAASAPSPCSTLTWVSGAAKQKFSFEHKNSLFPQHFKLALCNCRTRRRVSINFLKYTSYFGLKRIYLQVRPLRPLSSSAFAGTPMGAVAAWYWRLGNASNEAHHLKTKRNNAFKLLCQLKFSEEFKQKIM